MKYNFTKNILNIKCVFFLFFFFEIHQTGETEHHSQISKNYYFKSKIKLLLTSSHGLEVTPDLCSRGKYSQMYFRKHLCCNFKHVSQFDPKCICLL